MSIVSARLKPSSVFVLHSFIIIMNILIGPQPALSRTGPVIVLDEHTSSPPTVAIWRCDLRHFETRRNVKYMWDSSWRLIYVRSYRFGIEVLTRVFAIFFGSIDAVTSSSSRPSRTRQQEPSVKLHSQLTHGAWSRVFLKLAEWSTSNCPIKSTSEIKCCCALFLFKKFIAAANSLIANNSSASRLPSADRRDNLVRTA